METIKAIAKRQSCREYTGEQITKNELLTIIQAANAAPVGNGKYNEIKLTVIQNPELLAKINAIVANFFKNPNLKAIYGAPTLILISAKIIETKGTPMACFNAACIVENMSLAATDLNLGNVYILGAIKALSNNPEIYNELKIPQGFIPVSAIAIGKSVNLLHERKLTISKIAIDYI